MLIYYAHLGTTQGTARLLPGGYLFTPEDTHQGRLVTLGDPDLILHGLVQEDPDPRPLWQRVADPTTYNGTYGHRDLVRGR